MSYNHQKRDTGIEGPAQLELISLNRSVIEQVTDIVSKNEPASDLWPQLRKVNLGYKDKRTDILEKHNLKPKPVGLKVKAESGQQDSSKSPPDSSKGPPDGFKHTTPEEDVCIAWPLSPQLQMLLQTPATAKEAIQGQQASTFRSNLRDLLVQGSLLYQFAVRAVVCISPDTVVKINKSQDTTEAHILDHIHKHSQRLPIPRPLGMITIGGWSYTFTSFIPGIPLDRVWKNLPPDKKRHVQEQLNNYFAELRRLPLPSKEGYLGGGLAPVCVGGHRHRKESTMPIANDAQFNDFLLDDSSLKGPRLDYLRDCLPSNHRIVMTHGDLCPLNILVESKNVLTIPGIIDWETGGAYPEYWEYIHAFTFSFID